MKFITYLFLSLLLMCVQIFAGVAAKVIDGYAYLEDQTDHSGIKVLFEALTPSAQTDSTFTNINGYYNHSIAEGSYKVHYSKEGYDNFTHPDEYFINSNQTLPEVTLYKTKTGVEVSGAVSGTWDDSNIYLIVGDVEVQDGQTLTIEPGVRVEFKGYYNFNVYGKLLAQGTEQDLIIFTSGLTPKAKGDWNQIRFNGDKCDLSKLEYCVFEYGRNGIYLNNTYHEYNSGEIVEAYIEIFSSTFRNFSNCGLYIYESSPLIQSNEFYNCNSSGIYFYEDNYQLTNITKIMNNIIKDNGSHGIYCQDGDGGRQTSPVISENEIFNNTEDGIFSYGSTANFLNNKIYNNYNGLSLTVWPTENLVKKNQIYNNKNHGIFRQYSWPIIIGNTIYSNGADGIYSDILDHNLEFKNNIIAENTRGIYQEDFANEYTVTISYNDIYNNISGNFVGTPFQDHIGEVITVNANGDSCDTYFNIFQDAKMNAPDNGDFSLQADSPCIDAGDPSKEDDPDSTTADIGALYYNQSASTLNDANIVPDDICLYQNYPNPFNPVTNINFFLPKTSNILLEVYNILGIKICTLAEKTLNAGQHNFVFNASGLPSGIYIYQLNANSFLRQRKMILIK